ncbi:MAG: sulfate adenylyltransferase subunit CysD [Bacteroidota bacterium]|jgi:sulfate adenylyltransferase subunit 2
MFYFESHLDELESEAIYVLREVAAQFKNSALLFSGGKDSIVVSYLAQKAFLPMQIPFPLLHIDTGHNFRETIEFRDWWVKEIGGELLVRYVQDSIDNGRVKEEKGYYASRNTLQTVTLLDAINELNLDCCIGGARRDEEKARAKERFFSHRNKLGQWDPKNQRPELWTIYNTKKNDGEHFRVFPISNWTELDVWMYIQREGIKIPSLYFSHQRKIFERDGVLYADEGVIQLKSEEKSEIKSVRFRTIGDISCTGAIVSEAKNLDEIIAEVSGAKTTERGTRIDDRRSDSAMEERKRQGYF